MHHIPKITVWVTTSSQRLMELVFFNQTVNSECYLSKLHDSSISQLSATVVHARWCYITHSKCCLDFLHGNFDPRMISPICYGRGQKWPPNSQNINPCNFVLCGYLNEKLFPKRQASIMQLRASDCSNVRWNYGENAPVSDHKRSYPYFRSSRTEWWSYWACNPNRINLHELFFACNRYVCTIIWILKFLFQISIRYHFICHPVCIYV
jgi:hypothetical protein